MESIEVLRVEESEPLQGSVPAAGSKNVAIKLLGLAVLVGRRAEIVKAPDNTQLRYMCDVIQEMGGRAELRERQEGGLDAVIDASSLTRPYVTVHEMAFCRHVLPIAIAATIREGGGRVPLPGYSLYGHRPLTGQMTALQRFGAEVEPGGDGYVRIQLPQHGLSGADIDLEVPSVAATETVLMLAAAARGRTAISGAAQEPELGHLCRWLASAGVSVSGIGTQHITVESPGLDGLGAPQPYECPPDRIEIGALLGAVMTCGGDVLIRDVEKEMLSAIGAVVRAMGAEWKETSEGLAVRAVRGLVEATDIRTRPYPGFPTDVQGPFLSALCLASGVSIVQETVWTNRLAQAMELNRMGANIRVLNGDTAIIRGQAQLFGAEVVGTDPRAVAGLLAAGCRAAGSTQVLGIDLLKNAFDSFDAKLRSLGAKIETVELPRTQVIREHPKYGRLEAM